MNKPTLAYINEAHALTARDGVPVSKYGERLDEIRDILGDAMIESDGIACVDGSVWGDVAPTEEADGKRVKVGARPVAVAARVFARRYGGLEKRGKL